MLCFLWTQKVVDALNYSLDNDNEAGVIFF